jgi:hypothetical protein
MSSFFFYAFFFVRPIGIGRRSLGHGRSTGGEVYVFCDGSVMKVYNPNDWCAENELRIITIFEFEFVTLSCKTRSEWIFER